MNVQTGQARKDHVPEDQKQLGVVLPADGRDLSDAAVAPALRWQYMTPAEQWEYLFGNGEDR